MASECLKIRNLGGSGNSCLILEGTVLIYKQKYWFSESKIMIPIESIYISEHPRFYKDLLTLSLLIPVLVLIVVLIMKFTGEPIITYTGEIWYILIGGILFFELLMLLAFVFNFLFTKKSVCLSYSDTIQDDDIDSEDMPEDVFKIEFWKKRKDTERIDLFLEKLKRKQLQIENSGDTRSGHIFGIRNVNPRGILFGRCILFSLPAVIFLKYNLLLLVFIPISLHFYSFMKLMKQPKEFRQGLKYFRRKKWDEAIELLLHLRKQLPDYAPAMFLLLDTYIHAERFDEALTFSSEIPENYIQDSNALNMRLWQWKRIHNRRTEND
jgi:hypothetical protein